MGTPQISSIYDASRRRNRSSSFSSHTNLSPRCTSVSYDPSNCLSGGSLSPSGSESFPLPPPTSTLGSLSNFIGIMKSTDVPGPYFLKRAHEGKYLGRGAQFQVYGQCHGIDGGKTSYVIDQPYLDHVKKLWKRRYLDPSIDVAVKRTLFTLPVSDQNLDRTKLPLGFGSPDQLHNFRLEVLALCHNPLRNHRNIIKILGWGLDFDPQPNGTCMNPISPILIVERANCTLRDLVVGTRKKGLPIAIRQKLCLDVCNAVSVLHDSEIIHGDIKTDNVLVFPAERNELGCVAKISDFGLSIQEEEAKGGSTRCDSDIGTPGWQAPELRRDIPVNELARCDYFSLGLLVWSVISSDGGCPLKGGARAEDALDMATLFLQSCELPEYLKTKIKAVVLSLLQIMPQDRDSSLQDVSKNLSLDSTDVHSIDTDWAKELFKKPADAMTHGGIIARIHEDYGLYQVSVGSLGMKAPQQSSAPTEDQHTDTIAWNNDFELFPDLEYYDRITLVKAYLDGIDSIFRSSNHSATTEIVGPEFTHHEILVMAFSRTSEDLDYPVPAHIYLQQRAFCLLSSARKGSIVAGALIRHFVSVLPEKTLLDPEWSWTAVSYGLVLDWDLQAHNPQRHTDARRSFRKKGGYNTHYTMSQNCKPASCGLLANPLEWLETRHPLHHAAALGRMDDLEILLKKEGSYPDELDARGETPLMKACMAGSAECTKLLLRYGARPEIASKSLGTLPLHWLFVFDPTDIPDIADALYTKEDVPARSICNPDIPAFFFPFRWPAGTPLEWAVFANNTVTIDKLLELGFNLTDVREFFPATPRPRARDNDGILLEHTEALDLLEYCVYFESDMQFNRHPAVQKHRQCENERQSVQQNRLYIVREFRRRALKHYGSELNIAISTKRIQRVEFLLEHGSDINQYFPTASGLWRTTLCGAIGYDGNIELIRFLLEQGANVHGHGLLMNNTNIFPLTVAASLQDLKVVELLVEKYGANVNSIERSDNYDFGNALQAAILGPKDSKPLVRYLVSKGADVNAEAGRFHTALQCAALQCDVNIARILLSHGANVNTEGGQRWTALQAAAYQQNYKLVELLVLEHHVNIDACGGYGNHTALMAALTPVATPSIALFLLDHGADFKIHCGKDSRNALQAAVKSGAKTIVKRLLELGADPSVIKGKYLEDAVEAGSVKLLRILIKGGLKVGREEAIAVLPVAYKWGYVRMAEFLLDMAEDSGRVSAACEEGLGWTPQITSTRGGVYEVVMKHVAKTSSRR